MQLQWNSCSLWCGAIGAGALVGLLYGFLYTRFGLPSFVITLAGLLGFLGLQLWVLGRHGSISLPFDSWIVQFAQQMFLPAWASYVVAVLAAGGYAGILVRRAPPADRGQPGEPELPRDRRCAAAPCSPSSSSPPGI